MSRPAQMACLAVSGLLAIWALFLFFADPKLTFVSSDLEIRCDSLAAVGFSGELIGEEANTRSDTYDVVKGEEPRGPDFIMSDRLDSRCDHKRTSRVAFMVLLLAPASVLASVGLSSPRRAERNVAGENG